MNVSDAVQVVFLGLGTGFGSALGMELAKAIVTTLKERSEVKENAQS